MNAKSTQLCTQCPRQYLQTLTCPILDTSSEMFGSSLLPAVTYTSDGATCAASFPFHLESSRMLVPMPHMPAANVVSADSAALTALTAVHLEGFGIWSQSRTAQLVLEKLTHPRSKEMVECFLQIPSIISHECLKARGWIVAKSRSNPCGAWKSTDPLLAEASDS